MKKTLLLIVCIFLFSCHKSNNDNYDSLDIVCNDKEEIADHLLELGYSQEHINRIISFDEETISIFLDKYDDKYINLLSIGDFDYHYLKDYIKYYDYFELDDLVYLVNNRIVNDGNAELLKQVFCSEYYVSSLLDYYLSLLDKVMNNEYSLREMMEIVNTNRYAEYYTDIKPTDISKNYLMLINKYHALSEDYEPDDLVDIEEKYGRGMARKEVYDAFVKMCDDARELGYDFTVCSAYRSYDYQDGLYNKYLNEEDGNQAIVDTYSARPGHSEHQSGLCLDLFHLVFGMDDFGYSDESIWINENCYKYGFIIRYTFEKENITGYQAEPWQIRYVGSSEIAKDIMDRNITFDEYYTCFVE